MSTIRTIDTGSSFNTTQDEKEPSKISMWDGFSGIEHMTADLGKSQAGELTKAAVVIDGMEHMLSGSLPKTDFVSVNEKTRVDLGIVTTNIEYHVDTGLKPAPNLVVKNSSTTEIDWSLFPVRKIETKHVLTFAARTHSLDQINDEILEEQEKRTDCNARTNKRIRETVHSVLLCTGI